MAAHPRGTQLAPPDTPRRAKWTRELAPYLQGERRRTLGQIASRRENPLAARLQSRPLMLAFALSSFASAVRGEGSQGPAGRLLGIRLVDMRTGRPISRRQAVVRVGARRGW